MKNARFNASLVTLLSGFWISPLYAGGAMTVDISNIKSDKGTIFLMAFAAEKDFKELNDQKLVGFATAQAKQGRLSLELADIPTGCCALFAFHDENSNKDFDLSVGIPTEGYAFSRGTKDGEQPDFARAIVQSIPVTLPLIYW